MSEAFEQSPPEPQTKAEVIAQYGFASGGNRVARFIKGSPFLFISLMVHIIAIALLALFTATTPVNVPVRIPLTMEMVEIPEELPPLRREINLAEGATASGGLVGYGTGPAEGSESLSTAVSKSTQVAISKVNLVGVTSAVRAGNEGDFEGGGDDFALAPGKGDKTVGGAVDQFAVVTLNSITRGKTLVVLLIDQSRSIVYGHLPQVIQRMDHYFKEIENNLPAGMEDRGKWAVVSFGRKTEVKCEPTSDLAYVRNGLASIEIDTSGEENIGLAVETILARYAGSGYKHLLIAAMTDEAGDDINNPVMLEKVIGDMRKAGARFFVFGYESVFCARQKQVFFTLDPKVVKGGDRAAIKGFEGRTIWGWADGGPECPRPELWWTGNWGHWVAWGGSFANIPAGVGMYGLNRMVLATEGTYFLLTPESKYDDEKMYGQYKPDMCSMLVYDQRMADSRVPLRRALADTWHEMGNYYLGADIRSDKDMGAFIANSERGRRFCIERADALKKLVETSQPSGTNWGRWEAHADLTMAELLRFRFMLGQYHAVLQRAWGQTRALPPGKRLVLSVGKVPDDYVGPKEAKEEYDLALQYIERVINRHKGTPWEQAALRLKASVFPWKAEIIDIPKPSPGGPQPPSLAF